MEARPKEMSITNHFWDRYRTKALDIIFNQSSFIPSGVWFLKKSSWVADGTSLATETNTQYKMAARVT